MNKQTNKGTNEGWIITERKNQEKEWTMEQTCVQTNKKKEHTNDHYIYLDL